MKSSKLIEILNSGNLVIPILYNKGNNLIFDPGAFAHDLDIELERVMEYVSSLSDKNCLKVDVVKNSKNIMEEVIVLDDFYNKISLAFSEEVNNVDNSKSNIYEVIETEFGRTLSPIEYEIIKALFKC